MSESQDALIESANRRDWSAYVTRESTVLWRYLEHLSYTKEPWQESRLNLEYSSFPFKTIDHTIYHPDDEMAKHWETIEQKIDDDLGYFFKTAAEAYQQCDIYLDACREIGNKDYRKFTNDELSDIFDTYCWENAKLGSVRFIYIFDAILDDRFHSALEEISEPDANYSDLIEPEEPLPFANRRHRLLKLATEIQQSDKLSTIFKQRTEETILKELENTDIRAEIDTLANEFGWIEMNRYKGEPLQPLDIVKEIQDILEFNPEQKLKDLERKRQERTQRTDELLASTTNPSIRKLIHISKRYAHLRSYRMDAINIGNYRVRDLLIEIGNRLGISYDDVICMTGREIITSLQEGTVPTDQIATRKEEFATISIESEFTVLTGDDIDLIAEEDDSVDDVPGRNEVTGRIAKQGDVSGPAKIIIDEDDLAKLERGDIAVSPMTTRHMTQALEKVDGIVTDEGGTLSHAAVIAREMGIPCIVGTESATQVFKDGDWIEINGESGIVRRSE